MPVFTIDTNLKRSQVPATFAKEATQVLSSATGMPPSMVSVQVNPDVIMTFAGTDEPCAYVSLKIIGANPEGNRKLGPVITKLVEEKLGINAMRFHFHVTAMEPTFCVYNGLTVDVLQAQLAQQNK